MDLAERLEQDGYAGQEPVLFYSKKDEWSEFSNFSAHDVRLPHPFTNVMTRYRTGEHRYQAMKATTAIEHDWVREAASAFQSKERGRQVELRDPWGETYATYAYYVILETVLAKASQHTWVMGALMNTGNRPIYEDSPTDDIWGVRYRDNYRGKNLLGRCWMQTRSMVS